MQKAVRRSLPLLFCFLLSGTLFGQYPTTPPQQQPKPPVAVVEPKAQGCPALSVQAQPNGPIRDGQRVVFSANLAGADPKTAPTIVWSTTAGSVMQGQGSGRIEVDSTGAGSTTEREIKAEVWVGGYAPECVLQGSASVKVIAPAVKFGEFGEVNAETLTTNLKALSEFMTQTPDDLYLIAYAGRNSERNFTSTWLKRIRDGLIAAGVEPRRMAMTDGGFREKPLFDFWIVPAGSDTPRATPTIKRSEIVYPKTAPAKKP